MRKHIWNKLSSLEDEAAKDIRFLFGKQTVILMEKWKQFLVLYAWLRQVKFASKQIKKTGAAVSSCYSGAASTCTKWSA